MLLVPLVDRGLYPLLHTIGLGLGMLTKIGTAYLPANLHILIVILSSHIHLGMLIN